MAEGRPLNRRRTAEWRPEQSKTEMRNDLNRLIEEFLAKGGRITDCNEFKPGKHRASPAVELDDIIPTEAWD